MPIDLRMLTMVGLLVLQAASAEEPIIFRLVVPQATVCAGTRGLAAEFELRNASRRAISVSLNGIGFSVSFQQSSQWTRVDSTPMFRSVNTRMDPGPQAIKPRTLLLRPGESYRTTGQLPLDEEFFSVVGVYRVAVGYSGLIGAGHRRNQYLGIVQSNWVFFEIEKCDDTSNTRPEALTRKPLTAAEDPAKSGTDASSSRAR